tara:strand:+ start:689 stop:1045 length:357 start_codon:yes stop_codon:yes gene_type:complete
MIDTDKYEGHLKTVMDYMTDYFNGNWDEKFKPCPHCDEKEWPDSSCSCGYSRIPDILMHIQWSHDELFSPIHEMSSDLLAEVKRLREIEREWKQMWSKLEDYPDMCAELICFMESEEE